jgi:hypothetical protein
MQKYFKFTRSTLFNRNEIASKFVPDIREWIEVLNHQPQKNRHSQKPEAG